MGNVGMVSGWDPWQVKYKNCSFKGATVVLFVVLEIFSILTGMMNTQTYMADEIVLNLTHTHIQIKWKIWMSLTDHIYVIVLVVIYSIVLQAVTIVINWANFTRDYYVLYLTTVYGSVIISVNMSIKK